MILASDMFKPVHSAARSPTVEKKVRLKTRNTQSSTSEWIAPTREDLPLMLVARWLCWSRGLHTQQFSGQPVEANRELNAATEF